MQRLPYKQNSSKLFWAILLSITLIHVLYVSFNLRLLDPDEAQYWFWSQNLAWGYHSKGPGIAWLIHFSNFLFGTSEAGTRILVPFLYLIACIAQYYATCRWINTKTAFWNTLYLISLPAITYSATVISTDPLLLTGYSLCFYFFVKSLQEHSHWNWIFLGITIGLTALAKYTGLVFLVSMLLYFWIYDRSQIKKSGFYWTLAATLIILSPNLIWNCFHHFVTFNHIITENAKINSMTATSLHPLNCILFILSQFGIVGPIYFGLLICIFCQSRYWKSTTTGLLLVFTAPYLSIIILQSLFSDAHASWAAPVYLTGTILVTHYLQQSNGKKWFFTALILNVFLSVSIYLVELSYQHHWMHSQSLDNTFKRVTGWDQLGKNIQAIKTNHADANFLFFERKTLFESIYYGKIDPQHVFIWNPKDSELAQYEQNTKLHPNQDFWAVTTQNNIQNIIKKHFYSIGDKEITQPLCPQFTFNCHHQATIFQMNGFIHY